MEIIINTPVFLPLSFQSLFDNRIKEIWPERAAKDVSWEKSHRPSAAEVTTAVDSHRNAVGSLAWPELKCRLCPSWVTVESHLDPLKLSFLNSNVGSQSLWH